VTPISHRTGRIGTKTGWTVHYLREVLTYVLTIYLVVLIGRMIFGWCRFSP